MTALTLSVWVGPLTLGSGCAPVALASISCPPPTYCGLHWLRSLALPSRVLLSDLSPLTVLLVPSLSCEVLFDAEQGPGWGWGAYQRLEMMWMACWRVDAHSVSWGSFSIRSWKSQVKAESLTPGPMSLPPPSLNPA